MRNVRHAGRKPEVSAEQIRALKVRWQAGESAAALAKECGISRQALYRHFKSMEYEPARVEYYIGDTLTTLIEVDLRREQIHILNYVTELSKRAFGYNEQPGWEDFLALVEECYMRNAGITDKGTYFVSESEESGLPLELKGKIEDANLRIRADSDGKVPEFRFSKKDLLLYRSDTDGYQLKALSADRRYFVKAQAVMAGVKLRDWAVEIIAGRICRQFGIPAVEQKHCRLAYGKQVYDAVYAANFELDGYTFYSFESLLERKHRSSRSDDFIRMGACEKLKWCATQLSEIGDIPVGKTERYMLDLAVLDCLIGNVDRHTRNFGLFYNVNTCRFEIPPVFDNGMGLFEHDYYRDMYADFEEAMRTVYVSPYGEDPFELLEILNREYGLKSVYPGIVEPEYEDILHTPLALEYMERMRTAWRKLG